MFFASVDPFNNSNSSGQQKYRNQEEFAQSQQRDDDLDPIATVHHRSLYSDQAHPLQDAVVNNAGGYPQVPSAQPPWNPHVAAHASHQQSQLSVSYQTPTRPQGFMVSDEGYYTVDKSQQDTRSIRSGRSNSFGQAIYHPEATPRFVPEIQKVQAYSQGQAEAEIDSMASRLNTTRRTGTSEADSAPGPVTCKEEDCGWSGKTPSDLK